MTYADVCDRWKNILDPPAATASSFNLTFLDHKGRPFAAALGRTEEEVAEKTVVKYLKWRLDRAAHRHRAIAQVVKCYLVNAQVVKNSVIKHGKRHIDCTSYPRRHAVVKDMKRAAKSAGDCVC